MLALQLFASNGFPIKPRKVKLFAGEQNAAEYLLGGGGGAFIGLAATEGRGAAPGLPCQTVDVFGPQPPADVGNGRDLNVRNWDHRQSHSVSDM